MFFKTTSLLICFTLVFAQLKAQITAHFNTSDTSGCVSSLSFVYFIDSSYGGNEAAYTYKWVITDSVSGVLATAGFSPTLNTCNFTFSSAGTYFVTEQVTDGVDTASFTQRIHISPIPVLNFTTTPTTGFGDTICPNITIDFINASADTSSCTTNEWLWNISEPAFGFHVSLLGSSASYHFTQTGTYNVQLILTSCCGSQTITKNALINIGSTPVGSFSISSTLYNCNLPVSISFINGSTGSSAYLWKFGNGGTSTLLNPSHVYTDNAVYTDTLIAYNSTGCTDTVINIGDVHVPVFHSGFTANNLVCLGSELNCIDTTTGWVANKWIITPIAPATYATSSANNIAPSFLIPFTGTYIVYDSTIGSVCWNLHRDTITVVPLPIVSVTGTSLFKCTPIDTVHFFATVSDAVPIDYWLWQFGDPGSGPADTSHLATTVRHIYHYLGGPYTSYSPTLTVTDNNGCTTVDTLTNFVTVVGRTTNIFTNRDSGCTPLVVSYSLTPYGHVFPTVDSVLFGDSTASCIGEGCVTGTHTYVNSGHYKMCFCYHLPDSLGGCSYSDTAVKIHSGTYLPDLHLTMSADSVCPNTRLYLSDGCTNCTTRRWSNLHGTGRLIGRNDSSAAEIVHLNTPGADTIRWFGDVNGCYTILDTFVWVFNPGAIFNISAPDCSNVNTETFSIASMAGGTGFHWDFGDGTTGTGDPVTHSYASYGVYSVILVDTANNATNHFCTNTDTIVLRVFPIVDTFNIQNYFPCINERDNFIASRMQPDSSPFMQYIWKWGDGTSEIKLMDYLDYHTYSQPGIYWDTLIIKSMTGCIDTVPATMPVSVGPRMRLLGKDSICADATLSLTDSSVVFSGAQIVSRQWTISALGDIFNTIGMDTSLVIPAGNYNICIQDIENHGCSNYECINVAAIRPPHAYFYSPDSILHVCTGIAIPFMDTNSHCSYLWQFGDGTTSTKGPGVSHVFSNNDTVSNSIIISTIAGGMYPIGCKDTFTYRNEFALSKINTGFIISPSVKIAACPPITGTTFNTTSPFNAYTYWWKSTYTAISSNPTYYIDTANQFSINYHDTLPGIYTITLLDSNIIGCKDSVTDTFFIGGPSGFVTMSSSDSGCTPFQSVLTFHNTGTTQVNQYIWLVNGAISSDIHSISDSLTFNVPGEFNNFHIILYSDSDGNRCIVNYLLPFDINVFSIPSPPVIAITSDKMLCPGTKYQNFGASLPPDTNIIYTWSANNAHVFETGQTGQYSLINFDTSGPATIYLSASYGGSFCMASDTVTVNVGSGQVPSGKVAYIDNQFIYLDNLVDFYQWGYDNSGLDSTVLPNATYQNYFCTTPDTINNHFWVMTSLNGCIQKTYYKHGVDTPIHRIHSDEYIETYPNPSNSSVNVTIHTQDTVTTRVDIEDINGCILKSLITDNLKLQVDVSDLQQGIYIISCYQRGAKIADTHLVKE